jgi:hypothetical protein
VSVAAPPVLQYSGSYCTVQYWYLGVSAISAISQVR